MRPIDADELLKNNPLALIDRNAVENAPTVYIPDVIYCKDCEFLHDKLWCSKNHFSDGGEKYILEIIQDKMFCGEARRRKDAVD